MSTPIERSSPEPADPPQAHAHLPTVGPGEGCLEILSDRLRMSPGVVAIEANFRNSTLTVRYQPTLVSLDELNALADEVGAMFAQRVTYCERRESLGACEECALRLGQVPEGQRGEFSAAAEQGRVSLSRRVVPVDSAELVRPLSRTKPWGATLSPAEQEQYARGRLMAGLTLGCLVLLLAGIALEHARAPVLWHHVAYTLAAVSGGWFAVRSSLAALARFRFDVNLLMILAAMGAGGIGYIFEAAVLMFLFSLSNTLEVYTMGRTRRALHALLKLRPARAGGARRARDRSRGGVRAGRRARDRQARRGDPGGWRGGGGRLAGGPEQPDRRVGSGREAGG